MQRKKNIKLLSILVVLIVATTIIFMYQPQSKNINKNRFSLSNIERVDRVEISRSKQELVLTRKGRQWKLNGGYTANIARINDLLVIIEKVNVRRKVLDSEQEGLNNLIKQKGVIIKVFSGNEKLKEYSVVENAKGTLSYFIDKAGIGYICNIPGYNYHIANLFSLDDKGWRSNYVFASNWTTLDKLTVDIIDQEGFELHYDPAGYYIDSVDDLDTAKMYNYMERVSFLQAIRFLEKAPDPVGDLSLNISVYDAGNKSINLTFYQEGEKYYGWIDSTEWSVYHKSDILNLIRSKEWFETLK